MGSPNRPGGLVVHGGGVTISGSSNSRTVVNAGTVAGMGISLYGGRYTGSSGCVALMANTAAGGLKLFAGTRLDPGCVNDLVKSGTGPIEVQGGIAYGPASGVIAHGIVHLPFGTTNPTTCSPGTVFVNTTSGTEKICACTAANAWVCSALKP